MQFIDYLTKILAFYWIEHLKVH